MRGFNQEDKNSKSDKLSIEEYIKIIKRESVLQNGSNAFNIVLEALSIYGESAPKIKELAMQLVKDFKKYITRNKDNYWVLEYRCSQNFPITNDWLIDIAIEAGYKKIQRISTTDKGKIIWGNNCIRINAFLCIYDYSIIQTERETVIIGLQSNKMNQAIAIGLINLAIEKSKK